MHIVCFQMIYSKNSTASVSYAILHPRMQNLNLSKRKHRTNTKGRKFYFKKLCRETAFFKNVNVVKKKKRLRRCSRLKEAKEA